jgi:hypothetical protein
MTDQPTIRIFISSSADVRPERLEVEPWAPPQGGARHVNLNYFRA